MNDQATSPGCPEPEMISAIFDGELVPDEAVRAHLASCPDCARRLTDYGTISTHLTRAVASEPDPGFNARIAAFVRAESGGRPPVVRPRRDFTDSRTAWIFRIAALLILSCFFVYLLMDQMQTGKTDGTRFHTRRRSLRRGPLERSFPSWTPIAALAIM